LQRTLDFHQCVDLLEHLLQIIDSYLESGIALAHGSFVFCSSSDLFRLSAYVRLLRQGDSEDGGAGTAYQQVVSVLTNIELIPLKFLLGQLQSASTTTKKDKARASQYILQSGLTISIEIYWTGGRRGNAALVDEVRRHFVSAKALHMKGTFSLNSSSQNTSQMPSHCTSTRLPS